MLSCTRHNGMCISLTQGVYILVQDISTTPVQDICTYLVQDIYTIRVKVICIILIQDIWK